MKRNIIHFCLFLLVVILMITFFSTVLKRKYSDNEYSLFYENSKDYDVLFFGSSVVHYAISPMQLWNDYGITSYNMGNDSERLAMTYYTILNSFDYANPQIIVVDLTAMAWAGSKRDNTLKDHNFLDAVPLSKNKIKEVRELFEKDELLEYLFPFCLYHSRWNELSFTDFEFKYCNYLYGMEVKAGIVDTPVPTNKMYEESRYGDVESEIPNIRKIIDLCNEKGCKLVFTYLPGGIRGGDQKLREFCNEYLATQGVDFIDMFDADFIDWHRDFIDGGHVNYFGAEKVTDYLGRILYQVYNVSNHGGDSAFLHWDKNYMKYKEYISEYLIENLDAYNAASMND